MAKIILMVYMSTLAHRYEFVRSPGAEARRLYRLCAWLETPFLTETLLKLEAEMDREMISAVQSIRSFACRCEIYVVYQEADDDSFNVLY